MTQLPLRLVASNPAPPPRAPGVSRPPVVVVPPVAVEPPPPVSARAATLQHLRALVGSRGRTGIVPPPQAESASLAYGSVSTGIAGLDAWLRGWVSPGPIEIVGRPGAGRLALVAPLLARLTTQGRTVVLLDPMLQVNPAGLTGVDLARVVLVRSPGERAAWAAEQVARSGAVDALVVLDAPAFGRGGVRLARAAEAGAVPTFVLAERPEVDLPAVVRLEALGWGGAHIHVRCTRSRDGRQLGERWIQPNEAPVEGDVVARELPEVRVVAR